MEPSDISLPERGDYDENDVAAAFDCIYENIHLHQHARDLTDQLEKLMKSSDNAQELLKRQLHRKDFEIRNLKHAIEELKDLNQKTLIKFKSVNKSGVNPKEVIHKAQKFQNGFNETIVYEHNQTPHKTIDTENLIQRNRNLFRIMANQLSELSEKEQNATMTLETLVQLDVSRVYFYEKISYSN